MSEIKDPIISVILVTYNVEKYLKQAIESVFVQAYHDIEMIIVDDGSTDNTTNIINSYLSRFNIKVMLEEHTGNVGQLRNRAISISKGEIITFIDGDDLWFKDKLYEQMKYIDEYDMVCSNAIEIDESDNVVRTKYFDETDIDDLLLQQLVFKNYVLTSSVMISRKALMKSGTFEEEVGIRGEDYILWLNLAKYGRIKFISGSLIKYRRHPENLSYLSVQERRELLLRTIGIRKSYFNYPNILVSRNAKLGCSDLYSELMKSAYEEGSIIEAKMYCASFMKHYDNKVSLRFLKHLLAYVYLILLSKIKGTHTSNK